MNDVRLSRLLVWCGPVFAVLFLALSFISGDTPDAKSSAAKVLNYYDDNSTKIMATVFLSPLAAALLIAFAAAVRSRARSTGQTGPGPSVLLAGAVVWSAGLLLGSMVSLAGVDAADNKQGDVGVALNVLNGASWVPFIGGIAIFLIGAGLTGLGSRILPTWLGWVALVLGIVSLAGPGGFIGFFGGPLWMLVAGILLIVRERGSVESPAPAR
jgi:hypothetical protein